MLRRVTRALAVLAAVSLITAGVPANAEKVAKLVGKLSKSKSFKERAQVALILGKLKKPEAVEPLVEVLEKDPHHVVRASAAKALGLIGSPKAMAALQKATKDKDPMVAEQAASSLGQVMSSVYAGLAKDFDKKTYHFMIDSLVCVFDDINQEELTKYFQHYMLAELLNFDNFQVGTTVEFEDGSKKQADDSEPVLEMKGSITKVQNINKPEEIEVRIELDVAMYMMPEEVLLLPAQTYKGTATGDPDVDDLVDIQKAAIEVAVKQSFTAVESIVVKGKSPAVVAQAPVSVNTSGAESQ